MSETRTRADRRPMRAVPTGGLDNIDVIAVNVRREGCDVVHARCDVTDTTLCGRRLADESRKVRTTHPVSCRECRKEEKALRAWLAAGNPPVDV